MSGLRICLDARLEDGQAGGIQQFIMGLASGLSALRDGDEEYLFLSFPGHRGWLEPHLSGPSRALDVAGPSGDAAPGWQRLARALVPKAVVDRTFLGRFVPAVVPRSDGTAERAGADVVHLTLQNGFLTALPTIYQPYDLLHEHFPRFFSPYQLRWRRTFYATLSREARAVAVMSSWVKDDVVARLALPPDKVAIVPWGPVTDEYPAPSATDLAEVREELGLPSRFALYPAQTFPHKNHLGLLEAVALLRRETGLTVPVVCPGKRTEHFPAIARRARALGLEGVVTFPGYVSPGRIAALYRLATCLVFPSRFEGGGMPVFEAYAAGLPVACSNVTCLPRQAGDAALLFDPADPAALAAALERLFGDAALREELARRGRARVGQFSWERTARIYRALYRRVAGRRLTPEDEALLSAAPLT